MLGSAAGMSISRNLAETFGGEKTSPTSGGTFGKLRKTRPPGSAAGMRIDRNSVETFGTR